ncbi:PREDICTED: uncharacterized protein LOC108611125 [Drosophila arizonae]|uniref:Uncharacterized protein LOC108611125 n=1 Tax=Drosophila arizonae TaxID=7263 RepID=A0ABM1NVV5_DROAR|nr:PREDICTED: uncharacterized protein LOC108611125 [Drosophila arizonae]
MLLNPIEVICYYVVQPIIDFLEHLLNAGYRMAFYACICGIGVMLGVILGCVSVIWYKYANPVEPEEKQKVKPGMDIRETNDKQKIK